eukprot:13557884-Alexandrium_andersonii.AAC.1
MSCQWCKADGPGVSWLEMSIACELSRGPLCEGERPCDVVLVAELVKRFASLAGQVLRERLHAAEAETFASE